MELLSNPQMESAVAEARAAGKESDRVCKELRAAAKARDWKKGDALQGEMDAVVERLSTAWSLMEAAGKEPMVEMESIMGPRKRKTKGGALGQARI